MKRLLILFFFLAPFAHADSFYPNCDTTQTGSTTAAALQVTCGDVSSNGLALMGVTVNIKDAISSPLFYDQEYWNGAAYAFTACATSSSVISQTGIQTLTLDTSEVLSIVPTKQWTILFYSDNLCTVPSTAYKIYQPQVGLDGYQVLNFSAGSFVSASGLFGLIAAKPPIGYFTLVKNLLAGATTTTASTTPEGMSVVAGILSPLRVGLALILWFALLVWVFHRMRNFNF